MKKNTPVKSSTATAGVIITTAGLLGVLAGALLPILYGLDNSIYKYVYSAGAALSLVGRFMTPYRGSDITLKRLTRIEMWSSIFFCVAAFFMFYSEAGRDWIALTLAGGAVMLYTSIRIPRELAKEKKSGSAKK